MPRFSIKARLITLFQKSQRIDIWNNEILLKKSVVYTDTNLIQAAKKEIFMNYGADKKRAPEIKIKVIIMMTGFELSLLCLCLSLISDFKLANATQPNSLDSIVSGKVLHANRKL